MVEQNHSQLASELPRLFVFAEVARQGSFSAAAQALGLSRSTVSHHVSALEKELSVRLLQRTTRAVQITAAGEQLLVAANAIVGAWAGVRHEIAEARSTPVGTLVVTTPDVIAEQYVVPAVRDFVDKFPECDVDLRITPRTLDLIRERVDVAVRAGPLPDSSQGSRLLAKTTHIIVGAPALAEQWAAETPADLAGAPWLEFRPRESDTVMQRDGQTITVEPKRRVVVDMATAFVALTRLGVGFAMQPEIMVCDELDRGELVRVCPGWTASRPLSFHAVMPSPRPQPARVRRFIDLLVERFEA